MNVFEDDPNNEEIIEMLYFWSQYVIISSFGIMYLTHMFRNANGLGGPSVPESLLPIGPDSDADLETELTVSALELHVKHAGMIISRIPKT